MNGEKLKTAIKSAGYNQEEFAKAVKTNRAVVSKWINGQTPSTNSLKKISKVLNIPISYFLSENKSADVSSAADINSKVDLIMEKNKTMDEKMKRYEAENNLLKKEIEIFRNEIKSLKENFGRIKK